ncbi:hypothetical protein N7462_001667 [Penicillium macrosclerotiorum]|uniref:uncharacterized protein n=1 Tax=Penicillium macrosclerotiorum TaxID=303699 RepID=UPI002546A194|nr:uncharacterized protein N7462_001667 [Penicillium macrosclerotiorum]KAJ5692244.1 hypothetical protein N7462_001667 [Penicillium macrosclerotiorum]
MVPRTTLIEPVQALLSALTNSTSHSPISTLLATFTTQPTPLVHEHGLPQLAPFLGRSFTGQDGVARYFELLADHLRIESMAFESDDLWLVDDASQAIALRGSATFTWKDTGHAWDETFIYRVALAEDVGRGGGLRVCEYRVWADTGAAYLARLGRLDELLGGRGGVEGIHLPGEQDDGTGIQKDGRETRRSLDRKRSGCQDVMGGGLNVYGSCG